MTNFLTLNIICFVSIVKSKTSRHNNGLPKTPLPTKYGKDYIWKKEQSLAKLPDISQIFVVQILKLQKPGKH